MPQPDVSAIPHPLQTVTGTARKKSVRLWIVSISACAVIFLCIGRYLVAPDVSWLRDHNPQKTSFMQHRERQWRKEGNNKKITQRWVAYSRISRSVITAVVIAEDAKFWKHEGFDLEAIQSAIEADLAARRFKFGASTITQQLAKNLYLKPSKNPLRKIEEAILTWRLEKALGKRRILEIYLNVVEWGDGIFGIEAAARHYFGKPAAELDAMEAARLAAVLPNPIRFNPLSDARFVVRRTNVIHSIMDRRDLPPQGHEPAAQQPPQTGGTDWIDSLGLDSPPDLPEDAVSNNDGTDTAQSGDGDGPAQDSLQGPEP